MSAGAYDVVKEVLSRLGTVEFDKVAMQPGMPQGFGTVGPDPTPIFTLPGNPVSAFVSFEVFVRPAHQADARRAAALPSARAGNTRRGGHQARGQALVRARAIEVSEGVYVVTPVGGMGSHLVADLALANAFIVVARARHRSARRSRRCR